MSKFAVTALLLTALVVPVALFWLLVSRSGLGSPAAAIMAVAAGWALNVAWAFAATRAAPGDPAQPQGDTWAMATRYGWACPSGLVFLTWLAWRYLAGGGG